MIKVLKSGLYTSLQDQGRFGFRSQGIPVSGAMDSTSAGFANSILGNKDTEAVLEITLLGPRLRFECDATICITGALFEPKINKVTVPMYKAIAVKKNSEVQLGTAVLGMRGYIAVKGGFDVDRPLGSYSQYKGITTSFRLSKGAVLKQKEMSLTPLSISKGSWSKKLFSETNLTVTKGPEFDTLSLEAQKLLMQFKGIVDPQSNRMAYLLGIIPSINAPQIITSGVQPGTVQLTPSGQLMVLMRDAQTTGGYARVLQLTPRAIAVLSQKRPSEYVHFKWK